MSFVSRILNNASKSIDEPFEDRKVGLQNFGNTCYCNSVIQALYACKPFRLCAIFHKNAEHEKTKIPASSMLPDLANLVINTPSSLLGEIKSLFTVIAQKKKVTVISPKSFIAKIKLENGSHFY